jgi:hypothetical protein
MRRLVICAALFVVVGCATQVQLVGPYGNQISHADVQQIAALVVESEHYDHGHITLEAVRADKVRVNYVGYGRSTGNGTVSEAGSVYFTAVKRNGRWIQQGYFDADDRGLAH